MGRHGTSSNFLSFLDWIKAHIGLEGNKLADTQAKNGALLNRITTHTLNPVNTNKERINSFIITLWETRWENIHKHDTTKFKWFTKPIGRANLSLLN